MANHDDQTATARSSSHTLSKNLPEGPSCLKMRNRATLVLSQLAGLRLPVRLVHWTNSGAGVGQPNEKAGPSGAVPRGFTDRWRYHLGVCSRCATTHDSYWVLWRPDASCEHRPLANVVMALFNTAISPGPMSQIVGNITSASVSEIVVKIDECDCSGQPES